MIKLINAVAGIANQTCPLCNAIVLAKKANQTSDGQKSEDGTSDDDNEQKVEFK